MVILLYLRHKHNCYQSNIMERPAYGKTWNFKVGSLIFGLTIIISVMYWGGELEKMFHNSITYNTLIIFCTITGAVSGIFYALKDKPLLGIIPGAVGGAGSFVAFDYYTEMFHRTTVLEIEAALVCLAGGLPGLILYFILSKIFGTKKVAE